jgi:hypothetical protein
MCVLGGGLSADGMSWIATKPHFYLPVMVLSMLSFGANGELMPPRPQPHMP